MDFDIQKIIQISTIVVVKFGRLKPTHFSGLQKLALLNNLSRSKIPIFTPFMLYGSRKVQFNQIIGLFWKIFWKIFFLAWVIIFWKLRFACEYT